MNIEFKKEAFKISDTNIIEVAIIKQG